MNLISPTELARLCKSAGNDITKQAAHKAVSSGIIPSHSFGKKKLVDADDPIIQSYIHDKNRQRESSKKNEKPKTQSKLSDKKPQKKPNKSKKKSRKQSKSKTMSENRDKISNNVAGMSMFEINVKIKNAERRLKEAKAAIAEKRALPLEFVEHSLFIYLERFNSDIERAAAVFLIDIGAEIIKAGEVTPEHINKFTNEVLSFIDSTKKKIQKEIEKYEPGL